MPENLSMRKNLVPSLSLFISSTRLLLISFFLVVFPSAFLHSESPQHRLAFSKKIGIEVLAHPSQDGKSWCKSEVELTIKATSFNFFSSVKFLEVSTGLGGILSKDCPAANSAKIYGTAMSSSSLGNRSYLGAIYKKNNWRLERITEKTPSSAPNATEIVQAIKLRPNVQAGNVCPLFPTAIKLLSLREKVAPQQVANFYLDKYVRTELGADAQEVWRMLGFRGLGDPKAEKKAFETHLKKNYEKIDAVEKKGLWEEVSTDLKYLQAVRKMIEEFESIKIDLAAAQTVYRETNRKPKRNSKSYYLSALEVFNQQYLSRYNGPLKEELAAVAAYTATLKQVDLDGGLKFGPDCVYTHSTEMHIRRKLYLRKNGPVTSAQAKILSRGKVQTAHPNSSAIEFFNDKIRKNDQYFWLRYEFWLGASKMEIR